MKNLIKALMLALLVAGSVCFATVVTPDELQVEYWPDRRCVQVLNLVYTKQENQAEGVVTVQDFDDSLVHIRDEQLSFVLATDFMQALDQSSDPLKGPTVVARFGSFLRQALVVLCVQDVEIQKQKTRSGLLIKAGYLGDESEPEHSIYL